MSDRRGRAATAGVRKPVMVEVAGDWYDGEARSWDELDDGSWSAIVTWRPEPGQLRVGRFPATRLRRVGWDDE